MPEPIDYRAVSLQEASDLFEEVQKEFDRVRQKYPNPSESPSSIMIEDQETLRKHLREVLLPLGASNALLQEARSHEEFKNSLVYRVNQLAIEITFYLSKNSYSKLND